MKLPWVYCRALVCPGRVDFDAGKKTLTIGVDFIAGTMHRIPDLPSRDTKHDGVNGVVVMNYGKINNAFIGYLTLQTGSLLVTGRLLLTSA